MINARMHTTSAASRTAAAAVLLLAASPVLGQTVRIPARIDPTAPAAPGLPATTPGAAAVFGGIEIAPLPLTAPLNLAAAPCFVPPAASELAVCAAIAVRPPSAASKASTEDFAARADAFPTPASAPAANDAGNEDAAAASASLQAAAENPIAAHVFDASRPWSPAGRAMVMLDGMPYIGRTDPERAPRILGRLSPHMNVDNFAFGISEHVSATVSTYWETAKAYIDRYGSSLSPKTVIRLAKRFPRSHRDAGNQLLIRYAEQNHQRLSDSQLDEIENAVDFDAFVMFHRPWDAGSGTHLAGYFGNLKRRRDGRPTLRYPSLYEESGRAGAAL